MNSELNWTQAAQQMQETFGEGIKQAMSSFGSGSAPGFPAMDLSVFKSLAPSSQPSITFEPSKLLELQQRYIAGASALWNQGLQASQQAAAPADRRFSDPAWRPARFPNSLHRPISSMPTP